MTKKDNLNIKRDYLNKITQIQKYNKAYFIDSRPLVDDSIYDKLKIKVLELEKKYDFLRDKNSPSLSLGFKPSKNFQKVEHKIPMLSLANAFDKNDLINFEKKIINFLSLKKSQKKIYSCEPKIDGI